MNILVLAAEIPATSSMPGSPRLFNLCRLLAKNHRLSLISGCQLKERQQWFSDDSRTAEVFQAVTILPDSPNPSWWNKQRHRLHLAPHFQTQYLKPDYHQKVTQKVPPLSRKHEHCEAGTIAPEILPFNHYELRS
jgi:hypothetical protein